MSTAYQFCGSRQWDMRNYYTSVSQGVLISYLLSSESKNGVTFHDSVWYETSSALLMLLMNRVVLLL